MFGKKHGHRCQCAACISSRDVAYTAAQQLIALLGMQWIGFRHAVEVARSIRSGYLEWLPEYAQQRVHGLRGTATFESLLEDILD